ncbi:hypothetical protein BCR32DRAFT_328612 [Anaeromyces robustus]|uniref:G-protein coupled receptors family 3 profile domain-containing protein n=1 Tax=Anaeromyces robustus TaxID=1754192 RepID=A0A1Y1WXF1_9FUNG|nr:hypothetical protein BCR32DRAFT_328612 [Anaeromyces robustus]|eukprot:ORX78249.1 hypothetical protein BCR32DRAFT_328612 [Anaeromyces robustus]
MTLQYSYYQTMEDYVKSFSLYKCDVAMIEPALYDYHYAQIKPIYSYINETIANRMTDDEDGEIFRELLKDLQVNNRKEVHALPLFLDYGILYYRQDIKPHPPETWAQLSNEIDYIDDIPNFSRTDTVYIGQFNEYREFYYNLFENVLNTRKPITYEVVESETNHTINQFKQLFDKEIIDEYAWHLNSEYGVIRFNDEKALYMRNWSSFLYNVTYEYSQKEGPQFGIAKMLYSDDRYESSRAINKGIYICVASSVQESNFNDAVLLVETFSSKSFMEYLIEANIFYDIPVYHSLLEDGYKKDSDYCKRINCEFFLGLAEDHVISTYSVFYQESFLDKLNEFFETAKQFFKAATEDEMDITGDKSSEAITLESLMSTFSDYFEDKYVELKSATTIIMIIIVAIEILITSIVTYYLIKHRNFIEIRRSSPLFLITMLVGIILAFASILTFIGKPTTFICILRPYILVLTFGLTFFSLLLKTFRIKVIFDKVNIQVKDSNLVMYLCVLLGFELILVTIWSVAAGMKPQVKVVSREMHYYMCQNTESLGEYIQTILIIYNGLTLVYGCYLAYKVKNVYSEYNESKVIGLSIYGIVICMIILMFIVNINGLDHTTLFLIQSLMIILSADIILVFMFTPKLWKLHINIISEIPYDKPNEEERKASLPPEEEKKNSLPPEERNISIKNNVTTD